MEGFDPWAYATVEKDPATKDFIMQQTMLRIKDPKASLDFYIKVLGFHLISVQDFPQWGFSIYFVGYCDKSQIPEAKDNRYAFCSRVPGTIELVWNHGTEKEEGQVYNTGNADTVGTQDGQKVKGGYGHIGITVPDVYEACERFKALGCKFHKTPNSGGMKGLAFVKDPDGYLVEILPLGPWVKKDIDCDGIPLEGGAGYKDNSK